LEVYIQDDEQSVRNWRIAEELSEA